MILSTAIESGNNNTDQRSALLIVSLKVFIVSFETTLCD